MYTKQYLTVSHVIYIHGINNLSIILITDFSPDYQTFGNIMFESSYNNDAKQHREIKVPYLQWQSL